MAADFEVGDGAIADAGLLWCGRQRVHVVLAIDDEHGTTVGGVDLVVAVQGGIEECLCYATSTRTIDRQTIAETFFYNALHGTHKINATDRSAMFIIDGQYYMDALATTPSKTGIRYCAIADLEQGSQKNIPLWLFGFLY